MNKQSSQIVPLVQSTHLDLIKEYPAYEGMTPISAHNQSVEKDIVLNLIASMIIQGTTSAELWCVVRHSMVVLDAEKHNLDYKKSFKDHGIDQLMTKYQGV